MLVIPISIEDSFPTNLRRIQSLSDLYFFLSEFISNPKCEKHVLVRDDLVSLFAVNSIKCYVCKYDMLGNEILLNIEPNAYITYIDTKKAQELIDNLDTSPSSDSSLSESQMQTSDRNTEDFTED